MKLERPITTERTFKIEGDLAPAGTYVAECVDIRDRLNVTRPKFDNPTEMEVVNLTGFKFQFQGRDGRTYQVATKDFRISGNYKSGLFQTLRSWLGRDPAYGWDYMELKGCHALITVEHRTSKLGNVYANIVSISPVPQGMPLPQVMPQPASEASTNGFTLPPQPSDSDMQF